MDLAQLFTDHISHVQAIYEKALDELNKEAEAPNIDAVLLHSGSEDVYFADDRHIPFEPHGHFRHWLPVDRPDQMILVTPGKKPIFFQVVPPDFWYEQDVATEPWWLDRFEVVSLSDSAQVMDHLPNTRRIAFIGENTPFAADLGIPAYLINERHLTNYLDFHRGMKTAYEVAQLRDANAMAIKGHQARLRGISQFRQ